MSEDNMKELEQRLAETVVQDTAPETPPSQPGDSDVEKKPKKSKLSGILTRIGLAGVVGAVGATEGSAPKPSAVDIAQAFASMPEPITQMIGSGSEHSRSEESTDTQTGRPIVGSANREYGAILDDPIAEQEALDFLLQEAEPLMFGEINLNDKSPVAFSLRVNGRSHDINITPLVHPEFFSTDEEYQTLPSGQLARLEAQRERAFMTSTSPNGENTAVDTDSYGNAFVFCHSGYSNAGDALACESTREALEAYAGLFGGKNVTDEERQKRLNEIVGQSVVVEQDGKSEKFTVSAAGYVPNDELPDFEANIQTAVDELIEITGGEDSDFARFGKDGNNRAILVTFCGWGGDNDTVWSRYVVALEPENSARQELVQPETRPSYFVDLENEQEGVVLSTIADNKMVQEALNSDPQTRQFMRWTTKLFNPGIDPNIVESYINSYTVVQGENTDEFMDKERRGSTGSTPPSMGMDGKLGFEVITFHTRAAIDGNLVAEEYFQAHQYDAIAHQMADYLAGLGYTTPEAQADYILNNMRAFTELIQKKVMYDQGIYGNTYHFVVAGEVINGTGSAGSKDHTVDPSFTKLAELIGSVTDKRYSALDLLDPQKLIEIDDEFVDDTGYHVWEFVGLSRDGRVITEMAADMDSLDQN